jgi:excisionase family DNA binding protein
VAIDALDIVMNTTDKTLPPCLDELPDVLEIEEVAAVLRIAKSTAYQLVRDRRLGLRFGRRVVVPKARLMAFIDDEPSGRSHATKGTKGQPAGRGVRLADDLSADSICAFADQRGWLGVQMPVRRSATSRQGADDDVEPAVRAWTVGGGPLGEPIRMWRKEILRVRALKDLWGAVMAIREPWKAAGLAADAIDRAKALLSGSVQWSQGQIAYSIQMAYPIRPELVGPDFVWPRDWNPIRDSGVLSKIPTGDLATAGTFVVCHEINQSLEGTVDTTLLPFRSCEMRQVPQTLLASIYLQLAIEVAGGTGWRLCQYPGCGTRYPGRRNSKYCDRGTRTHRNQAAYLKRVGASKEASR